MSIRIFRPVRYNGLRRSILSIRSYLICMKCRDMLRNAKRNKIKTPAQHIHYSKYQRYYEENSFGIG